MQLRSFFGANCHFDPLRLPAREEVAWGRRVSCSAGEKARLRINRLLIKAVSPEAEKIMEMATNW